MNVVEYLTNKKRTLTQREYNEERRNLDGSLKQKVDTWKWSPIKGKVETGVSELVFVRGGATTTENVTITG